MAHGGDTHQHAAIAIDRAAGQLCAHAFVHGQRLTRQHGFIHLGLAFDELAIQRETLTWPYGHQITHQNFSHRHIDLAFVADPVGLVRAQGMQCTDGFGRLTLGSRFQPFAQQDQGDDHRRAFKVQMRGVAFVRVEPQPDREQPPCRGTQGHQQIHIARQGFERVPAGFVKTGPEDELHRCGQCELHPGGQHPVLAPQIAQHGQDQRCRQQQTPCHGCKTRPSGCLFSRFNSLGCQGLITRIANGAPQTGVGDLCRLHRDACRLRGQIDGGRFNTGHFFQGFFDPRYTRCARHATNTNVNGRCFGLDISHVLKPVLDYALSIPVRVYLKVTS